MLASGGDELTLTFSHRLALQDQPIGVVDQAIQTGVG